MLYLNKDNITMYGFARFYYSGEEQISGNLWLRDIEIAGYGTGSTKHLQIALPKEQLITLSTNKTNRIIFWEGFIIYNGNDNECISPINILSQRAGWNQTYNDIEKMVSINPDSSFIAALKNGDIDIPLGSGIVLQVGNELNWIGMILVHPELRKQGIGKEVMKHCIEFARLIQDIPILGLDATPMGMPLYLNMGFKKSFHIWRSTISTNACFPDNEDILIERIKSVDSFADYLHSRFLSDKLELFKLLFEIYPDGCFVAKCNGNVCGFLMSRPGRLKPYAGHLMADNTIIARGLLSSVLQHWRGNGFDSVFLDIPQFHFVQKSIWKSEEKKYLLERKCVLHDDIKPIREFVRMYQMLNESEIEDKIGTISEITDIKYHHMALYHAAESYGITFDYMEREKSKIQPYLFSTGGPEFS